MTKITALPAATTPLDPTDLVEVVQDVAGTPTNKKVPVADLAGGSVALATTVGSPTTSNCNAGATVDLLTWSFTPTYATLVTLVGTGTVYGNTGSGSAAGTLIWRVDGADVGAWHRWHTNSIERQMQVSTTAQALLAAGVATTIVLRGTNDGGSSQTVNFRDLRAARHEVTF